MTTTELRATPHAQAPEDVPLAWGDRLLPEAPALNRGRHSAKAAAGQVGYGVELLGSVPLSSSTVLLVAAHAHRAHELPDFTAVGPARADQDLDGCARPERRGGPPTPPKRRVGGPRPHAVALPPSRPRLHAGQADRAGGRRPSPADPCRPGRPARARHLRPLGRHAGAVGFVPHRGGWLRRLLRRERPRRAGARAVLPSLRTRRCGTGLGRHRRALRPGQDAAGGVPLRLGRAPRPAAPVRPAAQAHDARPARPRPARRLDRRRRPGRDPPVRRAAPAGTTTRTSPSGPSTTDRSRACTTGGC